MEMEIEIESPEEQPINLKMQYYLTGEMNDDLVREVINFFNSCADIQGIDLYVYINSIGGSLSSYNTIQNIFENSHMNITLINCYEVSSAAFLLFYNCKNVRKAILPNSTAMIHSVSAPFEHREIKQNDSLTKFRLGHIDACNERFLQSFKKDKILTKKQLEDLTNGKDVYMNDLELDQVMRKCPHGNYVENF